MNLKNFLVGLDIFFGTIWGFTIIDLLPLVLLNYAQITFSNLDNSIKLASALVGFVYFAIRIYFYYHKSKSEIEYLKQQTKELEIKNALTENTNYIFRKEIKGLPIDEYLKSKERLTKKEQ